MFPNIYPRGPPSHLLVSEALRKARSGGAGEVDARLHQVEGVPEGGSVEDDLGGGDTQSGDDVYQSILEILW